MALSIGDIIRVTARQEYDGTDDNINVFHFGIAAPPTPNTNASLLSDMADFMAVAYAEMAAVLSNRLGAVDITLYNVTDDVPIGVTNWGVDYSGGTGSSESMPHADCVLVLMPTGQKRTVGRIYISPLLESSQNAGSWNSTALTAVANFVDMLRSPGTAALGTEVQFGVYKRGTGLLYAVDTVRIQSRTAYQRRRKPGRGS